MNTECVPYMYKTDRWIQYNGRHILMYLHGTSGQSLSKIVPKPTSEQASMVRQILNLLQRTDLISDKKKINTIQ